MLLRRAALTALALLLVMLALAVLLCAKFGCVVAAPILVLAAPILALLERRFGVWHTPPAGRGPKA